MAEEKKKGKEVHEEYEEEKVDDLIANEDEGGDETNEEQAHNDEGEGEIEEEVEEIEEVEEGGDKRKGSLRDKLSILDPVADYIPLPSPFNYAVILSVPVLLLLSLMMMMGGEEEMERANAPRPQPRTEAVAQGQGSEGGSSLAQAPAVVSSPPAVAQPQQAPPFDASASSSPSLSREATLGEGEHSAPSPSLIQPIQPIDSPEKKAVEGEAPLKEPKGGEFVITPFAKTDKPKMEIPTPTIPPVPADKDMTKEDGESLKTVPANTSEGEKKKVTAEEGKVKMGANMEKPSDEKETAVEDKEVKEKEVKEKKAVKEGDTKPNKKVSKAKELKAVKKKVVEREKIKVLNVVEVQARSYFKTTDGLNYWEGDTYKGMEVVRIMPNYVVLKDSNRYIKFLLRKERGW